MNDKYTEGLTSKQKVELKKNIERSRKLVEAGKPAEAAKLAEKRPQPKEPKPARESQFTKKMKSIYNIESIPDAPSRAYTTLTGLSLANQKKVIARGNAAYLTAGSRRGVSQAAWSKARLNAFIVKTVEANKKGIDKINQDMDIFESVRNKIKMA